MHRYVKTDPSDTDWSLVMGLCEVWIRQTEYGSEKRARIQRKWRQAYFEVKRQEREWSCVTPESQAPRS